MKGKGKGKGKRKAKARKPAPEPEPRGPAEVVEQMLAECIKSEKQKAGREKLGTLLLALGVQGPDDIRATPPACIRHIHTRAFVTLSPWDGGVFRSGLRFLRGLY